MGEKDRVEVGVTDLEIGMWVAGLDRPWLETPFTVQGFHITSDEEIAELEKHCKFVVVDVMRSRKDGKKRDSRTVGQRADLRSTLSQLKRDESLSLRFRPRTENVGKLLFSHRKIRQYQDEHGLEKELPKAKIAFQELSASVQEMITEFESTQKLDTKTAAGTVRPMVESLLRNPDACIWLARLKSEGSYSFHHAVACAIWGVALGRQLGLPALDLQKLATGALLFDVGKLKLPADLLQKQGKLSKTEFELVRSHVQFGREMLQESGVNNRTVIQMVESHHERHAGHGYPEGLKGDDIPVFARIARAGRLLRCYHQHSPVWKTDVPELCGQEAVCLARCGLSGRIGRGVYSGNRHVPGWHPG